MYTYVQTYPDTKKVLKSMSRVGQNRHHVFSKLATFLHDADMSLTFPAKVCRLQELDGANVPHGLGVRLDILLACHGLF
jgi:hypothetical protein